MNLKCVLFDLDGTLLDTSYDFAYALNQTCRHFGQAPLRYQDIRKTVSQGGMAMTELAFPGLEGEALEAKRRYFLDVYFDHIDVHTRLFPGLAEGLNCLAERQRPWGIVTNKPTWLTEKLLQNLDFPTTPASVVCGDTLTVRKPHAEPLLLAAQQCGVNAADCIYLGDHPRDIEAGLNAGMVTGAAMFGYLPEAVSETAWPADYIFETPIEITHFIQEKL